MNIEPFTIPFDQSVVRDLRQRLALTRTPEAFDPNTWDYGTNLPYMKDLLAYPFEDFLLLAHRSLSEILWQVPDKLPPFSWRNAVEQLAGGCSRHVGQFGAKATFREMIALFDAGECLKTCDRTWGGFTSNPLGERWSIQRKACRSHCLRQAVDAFTMAVDMELQCFSQVIGVVPLDPEWLGIGTVSSGFGPRFLCWLAGSDDVFRGEGVVGSSLF